MGKPHTTPPGDPPMNNLPCRRRVIIGRNITLSAGAVYALTRFLYYATAKPESLSPAQDIITSNGGALGAWAAAWFIAGAMCIADMVNRHTRHGLSAVVGLAFAWGAGYLLIWVFDGFRDFALVSSAIGWLTPAALVFGLLIKVTALQDMMRQPDPHGGSDG